MSFPHVFYIVSFVVALSMCFDLLIYIALLCKVFKMSAWKAKHLSKAARCLLVQTVLSALPSYAMQTAKLPDGIINEIEKHCRKFLWGEFDGERHLHHMAWAEMCLPKAHGGLGIRNLKMLNRAMLAKLGWQFINQKESPWIKILTEKYGGLLEGDHKQNVSPIWRAIRSSTELLRAGLASSNYLNDSSQRYSWDGASNGKFLVRSAYHMQLPQPDADMQRRWKKIWAIKRPTRGNLLLWQIAHGKLFTNNFLFGRHIRDNPMCDLCDARCEDSLHALRDCTWARRVWRSIVTSNRWMAFSAEGDVGTWIHSNLSRSFGEQQDDQEWKYVFREVILGLWFWRNKVIHGEYATPPPPHRFVHDCVQKAHSLFLIHCSGNASYENDRQEAIVGNA